MREMQISKRNEIYVAKKELPKKILYLIIGAIFVLLIFTLITKNKLLLFLFLTSFSAIVNYLTNLPTIRFNPDPEVFASLLITRLVGFPYALFMLLIPTLFVDIYTARLDKDTLISLILTILINYVMSIFSIDFVIIGLILVTIKFLVGLAINMVLDISPSEILFEHVLGFLTNIILFLSFGAIIHNFFI
jgi:hypothetical protein